LTQNETLADKQHGLEPGYYLAFITGGIYVSLGRQFRRLVRPLVMSASTDSTQSSEAPNSLPKYPYPNLAKRVYDVIGWSMVQMNLNYTACAFLILGFKDSLRAWNRMWWYGHVMIIASSLFFHFGGKAALKQRLPPTAKRPVPSINVAPPSPIDGTPGTPRDEYDSRDIRWIKHALDNPTYKDSGRGVNPGDMLDEAIESDGSGR
jgi:lysophospholipid acyltransferase